MRQLVCLTAIVLFLLAGMSLADEKDASVTGAPAAAKGAGGADAFGYCWTDSDEPGGPAYSWIEISGTGAPLDLTDDGEANIVCPFPFTFYGVTATDLRVGNNGGIIFNATTGDVLAGNSALAANITPPMRILPFWDDIDSDSGNVYWEVQGTEPNRRLIVEWYNRPHFSNYGSCTFELILSEGSNDILFQYADVNFDSTVTNYGASATIGIQGDTVDANNWFLQYSFNTASLHDNMAIWLYEAPQMVWSSPTNGAAGVHPTQPIVIAFSKPMNPATFAYSCVPPITVTDTWSANHDTLVLDPVSLSPATYYTLQIGCLDTQGHPLGGPDTIAFTTAGGDSLETVMGSFDGSWAGAPRMRGNFFLCDANTIVKEFKWYLNPADTLNLWFAIYEGDSAGGTFDLKFSRMVRTPDTIEQWYTTGPMNFRMASGKYYFYAMVWDASVTATYFRGAGMTYPYPFSFGDLVGVCGYAGYPNGTPATPPQDTLEVPATAFDPGNLGYYQQLLTIPENPAPPILVFEETPGDTSHYYQQAAMNLGYRTAMTIEWMSFIDSLYNGTNWTMALVNNYDNGILSYLDTLNHYLTNGGKMVFYTWNFASDPGHPFYANLGASFVAVENVPLNVHANDPADALFTTPNEVASIVATDDPWGPGAIESERMLPASGGTAVAWFEGYPGEAALIANAAQTALFNGFESVCYNADSDIDGKLDIVELIENEIVWLLGPTPIGVEGSPQVVKPGALMLAPNYPNPFRGSTSIEFQLPKAGRASLKVYNILGQAVATLVDGELTAGRHQVTFNARGLANGIYLYRLEAGGQRLTRKLAVIK